MTGNAMYKEPAVVKANGIDIIYDAFGDPSSMPLLLIMGLGRQMISWDHEFCASLSERGYYVIRFDNRDAGLSTSFNDAGIPNFSEIINAMSKGENIPVPYNLPDMADDTAGLIDALGMDSAHIVGASMGGMIAQVIGISHPEHVRTITSIMSTTGDPNLPTPAPEAMKLLLTPTPTDREGYIEYSVPAAWTLSGPGYPIDEDRIREKAAEVYDRSFNPAGFARQYAAVLASGSRKEQLKTLAIPTLVIHGDSDPLVPVEHGIDTARTIPGAKLVILKGMGHDLPPAAWPKIIDEIGGHAV